MAKKPPNNIWIDVNNGKHGMWNVDKHKLFIDNIGYVREDIADDIVTENVLLQKQVHRLEEELIKKTIEGSDVSSD